MTDEVLSLEPKLKELAFNNPSIPFLKVDLEKAKEIKFLYGIEFTPVIWIFRHTSVVERIEILTENDIKNIKDLEDYIEKIKGIFYFLNL